MKFIGVNQTNDKNVAEYTFYHIVDSALVNNGKPFFIPNFASRFEGRLCLMVRISRLGRSISERYAYRYFDAIGIACRFVARDFHDTLIRLEAPSDMATSFDGAVNISNCIILKDIDKQTLSASLLIDGKLIHETEENDIIVKSSRMIAAYSKYSTIRQGDYLLIDTNNEPFIATQDTHIDGYLNGQPLLSFNIK